MLDGDPNLSQVPRDEGLGLGLDRLSGGVVLRLRSASWKSKLATGPRE